MSQSSMPDITREALALEAAGLNFIIATPSSEPRYVSIRAAALLGIDTGGTNHTALMELLGALPLTLSQPFSQEHHLRNTLGHTIAAKVHISSISVQLKLIVLHPLSESLPLIEHVERNHKLRPLLVFLASSLGPQDDLVRISHRLLNQSISAAGELFPAESTGQVVVTDLQSVLTRAVSIADVFLPSTVKVSIDAKRPALINLDAVIATRIVSHTLLEGAAFTAGCGEIRVRAVLGLGKKINEETSAEVILIAERTHSPQHTDGNWLHQTLLKRTQHQSRRVTVADEEPMMKQLQSGEGLVSGSQDPSREISRAQYSSSIPVGGESADLFLARNLANTAGVTLQISCPDTDVLACYLSFPLSSTDLARGRS